MADSHTLQGTAGLRFERVPAPDRAGGDFVNLPGIALAKVITVHPESYTVDCVGIGQFFSRVWQGVHLVSLGVTPFEGLRWLPTIDPGTGDPAVDGVPGDGREAYVVLGFVGGNPEKPIGLGFHVMRADGLDASPGDRVNVHASGVYERTTATGTVEHAFADGSYLKAATPAEGPSLTPVDWGLQQSGPQQFTFVHSSGTRIQLNADGSVQVNAGTGQFTFTGGSLRFGSVDLVTHTHQYTDDSDSGTATKTTGGPQ